MNELSWPAHYDITVNVMLDERWAAWFDGLSMMASGDRTVLSGVVADEAALHGLIGKVRDLGLPLVSVCRRGGDDEGGGGR